MDKEVLQQRVGKRTKLYETDNEVYALTFFVFGQTTFFTSFVQNKSLVNLVLSISLLDS